MLWVMVLKRTARANTSPYICVDESGKGDLLEGQRCSSLLLSNQGEHVCKEEWSFIGVKVTNEDSDTALMAHSLISRMQADFQPSLPTSDKWTGVGYHLQNHKQWPHVTIRETRKKHGIL